MLLFHVVREIFALEDAVSFNFALGAPLVKRRVKSRRPASAAPNLSDWYILPQFPAIIYAISYNLDRIITALDCSHRLLVESATWLLMAWRLFGAMVIVKPGHQECPMSYPNGPEAGREAGWGSEFVPLKKREVGSFILLHKISRTACCFGIRTFLKQYNYYESATNWYTDHQYLAQYNEIINNLQEIPLIFCNYAVRSCGTWRKGPGQSPCNGLSISDLELYVTETSMGVCDPVTD